MATDVVESGIKVCVLGLRGLPDVMGGVEMHCEQLFPLMKERRPNDTFIIIGRKAYLASRSSEYCGLKIVTLPHARGKYLEAISNTAYGVGYAWVMLRSDLLHLHGIGPSLMAPIAKALGMKVIVTYHSKNYEHDKWNRVAKLILQIGELLAVVFADGVIAVSRSLARDLKTRFRWAADKIHFIPNGANHVVVEQVEPEIDEAVLQKYGLERGNYIVSVGRLVPEKGFHDLLAAFCRSSFPGKLVIAGDADYRDRYSQRLLEKADHRVVFTGFVSKDLVRVFLAQSSLFVLPSYNEGLPIAALEAIAIGAPVLLSDIEANLDLGLAPGNYFKVGDVDQLRSKISQDHEYYRLGQSERSSLLSQYDWHAVCMETDKLYSTVKRG